MLHRTNSGFTNNVIGHIGGGLYIHTGIGMHNNITITNSVFTNNTIISVGGGLVIYTETDAHNNITITNSAFTNNYGGTGGLYIAPTGNDTHTTI